MKKTNKRFIGSEFKNKWEKWENLSLNIIFKNKNKNKNKHHIFQKSDLNLFAIPTKEDLKSEKE